MRNWIEIGRMDELARQDTPIHHLDARAKALVTLAFVGVVMSFDRYALSALMPFLLYPVVLVALARIPAWIIVKKILIAAPFALVIGMFNPFLDRQPVGAIGSFVITGGWISFASIMLRFVLTVGAALTLVAGTGMHRLGAGLERLGVPHLFVTQLLFLYRYLFVVCDEAVKLKRGVELRSNGRRLHLRVYTSLIGNLLLRSLDRAERIYQAMIARGFDGRVRVLRRNRFGWRDAAFVCGCLAFFTAARAFNLSQGLGRLLVLPSAL